MGANVTVTHVPTGTKYGAVTDDKGYFLVPSVRPGGPYTVQFSYVGYKPVEYNDIEAPLGKTVVLDAVLNDDSSVLEEVVIVSQKGNNIISKDRTGASQQFSRSEIAQIPATGSRTIDGVTKYNPNGNGSNFGGQDSRLNNFTIDGSVFNNGFGLGSSAQAGGRTGSTAISMDAIEQLQINIAPFDIRQSGFTGAGLNAVTRSGTNQFKGSVYYSMRNESEKFLGRDAGATEIVPGKFDESVLGFTLGAPIVKDKIFFFANAEFVDNISPATNWTSSGSPNGGAQVSLPTYQQMSLLSNFLADKFDYATGPWENFDSPNVSKKFLGRLDWNINDNNKLTLRYVHHDSSSDVLISNSSSLGTGSRTNSASAMSFQNSGYQIFDNTRSIVAELNTKFTNKLSNSLIAGYDKQIEDRGYLSPVFPTVDVRNGSASAATLLSFGMDPFTPQNQLNYSTIHVTDNLTYAAGKHTLVLGANYEYFKSYNMFYPGSHGVYVYNNINDFYRAAYNSVANNGAPSVTGAAVPAIDLGEGVIIPAGNVVAPARFQFRYSALEGGADPMQEMVANRFDPYFQDEIRVNPNFKLTLGLRAAVIWFGDTALENTAVTNMTFANGEKFNTGEMPDTQILLEPRLGFNLDVRGNQKTQLRGGLGIFTGRPPYVFVSNQVGNNGVLTGFIDVSGSAANSYGFTANPAEYFTPTTATLPTTFDLAFTDSNFKFPQVFKVNLAVDQKLPLGFVFSAEAMFNKNINEVFYYNANLKDPIGTFNGPDNRPRYANTDPGTRINNNVSMGAVLSNSNQGYYQSYTLKLEYPNKKGLFGSAAYTRSETKDLMSAGSIASGSWTGARSVNGNNDLDLSYSDNDIPHRWVGLLGYKFNYGKELGGGTSITLGYIGQQSGRFSYTYSGDMNGDRISGNDLVYIPMDAGELKFEQYTLTASGSLPAVTYTVADQVAAFNAYMAQDDYLKSHKGQYAERNSNIMPSLHRFDFSVAQDFYIKVGNTKNALQVRADILNFSNLLNKDWGVSQRYNTGNILQYRSTGTDGIPVYRVATQIVDGQRSLIDRTFIPSASVNDVWRAQLTLRYNFN